MSWALSAWKLKAQMAQLALLPDSEVTYIHRHEFATSISNINSGPPACWLVHQHFERFLIGADPRDTNHIFEQMYRASMFYGRKGLPVAVISVIDLALWDLQGKVRNEPVYKLIGGATREKLDFYCTGPEPTAAKKMGFWGAKVPLPYCPEEGHAGLRKNVEFLRKHRESVGPDFPIMVDCYMSLNVQYTIEIVKACLDLNINWWEECLSPDDTDGFALIKRAHPQVKFTTGEHEYSRYGFRKLIEGRNLDIIQPDVMWLGGLTELLKVSAMAAAYDIPVVPHASGPYSYHYVISQTNCPFQEYLANSPDGKSVLPVFGDLFIDEPIPVNGYLTADQLDKPGFGLTLNPAARLIPAQYLLTPNPERPLGGPLQRAQIEAAPVAAAPVVSQEASVPAVAAQETAAAAEKSTPAVDGEKEKTGIVEGLVNGVKGLTTSA
jgi:L-rhamnonate dehydratase